MSRTVVVVPCYNESRRLRSNQFCGFANEFPNIDFLFVNDGSTDGTLDELRSLQKLLPDRVTLRDLDSNVGKAEAVRQGMLSAFEQRPDFVGFWDADLATPLEDIPKFGQLFEERSQLVLVMGSRVSLLGRQIDRKYWRHLLGRLFATVASMALGVPVYDTQCGAKLFRATPEMQTVFATPFRSRWIFDVEILARMIQLSAAGEPTAPQQTVAEFPLQQWTDVAGSKLRPSHFVIAVAELSAIYWELRMQRGQPRILRDPRLEPANPPEFQVRPTREEGRKAA